MQMYLFIRTSQTSFLNTTKYPVSEAEEANLEYKNKFLEEVFGSALKDGFFYQGDIVYFLTQKLSYIGLKE